MDNTTLGKQIISYLKYQYAANPNQKDLYHKLADQTRQIFSIYDYGSDVKLDPNFDPNTFDWTETKNLLGDWTKSNNSVNNIMLRDYANSLIPLLGLSIQEQTKATEELKNQGIEQGYNAQEQAVQQAGEFAQNIYGELEQNAKDLAQAQTDYYGNQLNAEEIKALGELNAQKAQYQSLLGNDWVNGVLNQLGQIQAQEIDSIDQQAIKAKQSAEAQAQASRTQVNADYAGVIDEIKQAANEARQMKNEDLNARGMYFSSVLTDALDKISAAEIQTIGKTEAQRVAKLAKIAADLVTATANIDINTLKSKSNIVAQFGLQKLNLIAQDSQQKAQYEAILAGLEAQTPEVQKYYETLKEGLPTYQQIQEAQNIAPIEQAKAQQAIQTQAQLGQIRAEAEGVKAMEPYNLETAVQNNLAAYNEYKAKQNQQSFDNYIKQQNLLINQQNANVNAQKLYLTAKMDEAQIKNLESQEKLRDAQIWKIYNDTALAGQKADATSIMSLSDANKLIDKKHDLISDILQQSKIVDAPLGTKSEMYGTEITEQVKAKARAIIQQDREQLALYSKGFLMAQARIIAEYDSEAANAAIGIQQFIYNYFNAKTDNDLDQYSVKQFYENATYEGFPLSQYLINHGYGRAADLLTNWISTLPQIYVGHS